MIAGPASSGGSVGVDMDEGENRESRMRGNGSGNRDRVPGRGMDEGEGGAMNDHGQTGMAGMTPAAAAGTGGEIAADPDRALNDLAALREALLKAYPRAVPELVGGGSVAEMLASLEGAMAAWERVAAGVALSGAAADGGGGAGGGGRARGPEAQVIPVVPAGASPAAAVDPERLPSTEKIRRGLIGRQRGS